MRITLLIFAGLSFFLANAQTVQDTLPEDSRYFEDQFYLGITYNFLLNKPDGVSQRNLSYGLQAGFIKDIPLNHDRTVAFGIGLGYGAYSYYSNLIAEEVGNGFSYRIPTEEENLKRNKIETHMIELPIEFRWRNSTTASYKFWRIYTGVKLGYLAGARSKAVFKDYNDSFYNREVGDFQYGLTFNFGYNTFNMHIYYALNDLFDGATTSAGEDIKLRPLRIGLIFYIL
jgi:hypothetical protein